MDTEDDYTEIVLTFDADFSDPDLHLQLVNLSGQLQQQISGNKNVTVTKVEPWNSVRVTLNISKDAALTLQRLAKEDGRVLRDLGILSVQLHGNRSVYLGDSSHNDMASETVANQFKETSGNETSMPCTWDRLGAGDGERLRTSNPSCQSFLGKQKRNNIAMPWDCFQDGLQPLEHFVYPPSVQSVAEWHAENPDANFNFSNDRLAFHQFSGSAFDNVIGPRSVSQFSSAESKQSNAMVRLRGRCVQSTGIALRSDRPVDVHHVTHHRFSGPKSSSAKNTNCALVQNYGSIDSGTGIGNCDASFRRQWQNPRARTSAAQRRPLKEETIRRDTEYDSAMWRNPGCDPWLRGLGQESKEIYSGLQLAQSQNHHHKSFSSESRGGAAPVTDHPVFAQHNSFQNTQHSWAEDRYVQSNFINNQINSVPLNHLAKSQTNISSQTFSLRPNRDPYPSKIGVSDKQCSASVKLESLPEVHNPDMSTFSPASPENLSHTDDGVFCDSETLQGAESSKLAVERALSLLSDATDDAPNLPVEKECRHSSRVDLVLSSSTGSSHQGILREFQAYSRESNCFTTRTQPITSVAINRTRSFNHAVEVCRKSPSALKKSSHFRESTRRSMPCLNNANDDFNYLEPKSIAYDHANGCGYRRTASTCSNVSSSSSMLEAVNQNNVDSRSGGNYVQGNRDCSVAFYPHGNKDSVGSSFPYSAMPCPKQQDMVTALHNPFMSPRDRYAPSSKSSKFNFTHCSLSTGPRLRLSPSIFPSTFPAVRESPARFTCRVQSQDKSQTTIQTPEGVTSGTSPRDTCSWMESELCSSIPDSGVASNTSSGGSSDLSELERTLGGSLENFNRCQDATEARDGCGPDGGLEEGTRVSDERWLAHLTISNASCVTTSRDAQPSLSVCGQAMSRARAVGFGNTESHMGNYNEGTTSVVVQQNQDKGMSFELCSGTLRKRAPGLLQGIPRQDNSVRMHTISKVSTMKTDPEVADSYQSSRVKLRIARNSSNGDSSSSRSCFEPLITCPSLPRLLSESVKLAMQGVPPVATSSFASRETAVPTETVQASTIIRITKTKSAGIHSNQKDTWCIQPVVRCQQETQCDEKTTSSGMTPTPYTTETIKSPTAEDITLQSNNLNRSSQNITSGRNKLCTLRLKPGRNSISANSLRTKKLEISRPTGADRHRPSLKGQTGEFKQMALSGSPRLLAERTVLNCSRAKVKRLDCVQLHNADD